MAKAGGKKKVFRKKEKKNVPVGIVHIAASFNNTMISITDLEGNLIAQSSAGARGFRGSRKGTPFAAQQAAYEAAKKAHEAGMQQCEVRVKGPGGGRESAIRAIANAGIRVMTIRDYDADSAQWMPAAKAAKSLRDFRFAIVDFRLR